MNKTEQLLALLIKIIIDTHNYVDLTKYRREYGIITGEDIT